MIEKKKGIFLVILVISVVLIQTDSISVNGRNDQNNSLFYPTGEYDPLEELGDNANGSLEWDIVPGIIDPPEGDYYKCLLSEDDGCNVNHPWNDYTPDYYFLDFIFSNNESTHIEIVNIILNINWLSYGPSVEISLLIDNSVFHTLTHKPIAPAGWFFESIPLVNISTNELINKSIKLRLLKVGLHNAIHFDSLYLELTDNELPTSPLIDKTIGFSHSEFNSFSNVLLSNFFTLLFFGILIIGPYSQREKIINKIRKKNLSCRNCNLEVDSTDKYCFMCGFRQ